MPATLLEICYLPTDHPNHTYVAWLGMPSITGTQTKHPRIVAQLPNRCGIRPGNMLVC